MGKEKEVTSANSNLRKPFKKDKRYDKAEEEAEIAKKEKQKEEKKKARAEAESKRKKEKRERAKEAREKTQQEITEVGPPVLVGKYALKGYDIQAKKKRLMKMKPKVIVEGDNGLPLEVYQDRQDVMKDQVSKYQDINVKLNHIV